MTESSQIETILVNAGERKSKVVHARFGLTEFSAIEAAAKAAHLTVSGFIRSLVLEGAGVRPFFTETDLAILDVLLAEIRAVGINLNKLTRAANRRETVRPEEERAAVDDVHRSVAALLLELKGFAERGARITGGKA